MIDTDPVAKASDTLFHASRPRSALAHWTRDGDRGQLFVVNGSRLFDVDEQVLDALESSAAEGEASLAQTLARLGLESPTFVEDQPLVSPPAHAFSLAIAQRCNLGCAYCYANQGSFGSPAMNMSAEIARQAVDMLIKGAKPGSRVLISFMGGEPLANRDGLRQATLHAIKAARERGVDVSFAITTNGTLLTESDADFFEEHGFAVTVSLDGVGEAHDRRRSFKDGRGSFDRIMINLKPLLKRQRKMQVSVRATVSPDNLDLRTSLDFFLDIGFHSVGFSPLLRSFNEQGEFSPHDLSAMLDAMVDCGREFERRVLRGARYAFSNMVTAMRELHRGTHRPYPCGAGAGYFGISANGEIAACHRFVGDRAGAMGNLSSGLDRNLQDQWLRDRHVHRQSPCRDCWAQYLCGGGCHHEVIARGRPACDYIRGWLHYCLQVYGRLRVQAPEYFQGEP